MRLIDANKLYKEICELEELALNRVIDTPTNSPCYDRYSAQLNERTSLKHRVFDQPTVQPQSTKLLAKNTQLRAERDAALEDLFGNCKACIHADCDSSDRTAPCWNCTGKDCKWQWRGPANNC